MYGAHLQTAACVGMALMQGTGVLSDLEKGRI